MTTVLLIDRQTESAVNQRRYYPPIPTHSSNAAVLIQMQELSLKHFKAFVLCTNCIQKITEIKNDDNVDNDNIEDEDDGNDDHGSS